MTWHPPPADNSWAQQGPAAPSVRLLLLSAVYTCTSRWPTVNLEQTRRPNDPMTWWGRRSSTSLTFYRPQEKVMFSQTSVCHSIYNRPHDYSVTAHPCYGAVSMHPTGMLSCFKIKFLLCLTQNKRFKLRLYCICNFIIFNFSMLNPFKCLVQPH